MTTTPSSHQIGALACRDATGEMLVFNNQRLLHGRTAFGPSGSRRQIRSCHVELDQFHSSLRLLYRKPNDPRRWMTFRKG